MALKGILTLYLDKESYERAGMVGKPDGVKGKRGTKPRWSTSQHTHGSEQMADMI
jgi:hypothetical protein